ncbi:hypothetical protein [Sphingomonas sp.]|jgi:hypothetical protein|uniref:hypothetical protein n=1 Tax=Sphingomonas sp. TaxID=28214 RepID=UPI002ED7FDD5
MPKAPVPDPTLKIGLDINHKPVPGWQIRARPVDAKGRQNWEVLRDGSMPLYLGYFFEYSGYSDAKMRGLARTSSATGGLAYEPSDWTQFGYWPELLYPTAWAESNAVFTVINAWDRAAMTLGFIQLAAHTGDDFLPFFRTLIEKLPAEARQWFPELAVIGGRLCFMKGGKYRSLEEKSAPWDGGYTESYYHGDLMGFFNPDRYHAAKPADPEELHSAARWLTWTLTSKPMRELQVQASIDNLKNSLKLLHRKMLADPAVLAKYPKGVDGMRCDLLAMAIAAPHLGDRHVKVILGALKTADPIEAIRISGYGPGGRSQNTYDGMIKRPKLKQLKYDLAAGKPV